MTDRTLSRRQVLAGSVVAGVATVAGCLGGDGNGDEDDAAGDDVPAHRDLNGLVLSADRPLEFVDPQTDERLVSVNQQGGVGYWNFEPLEVPRGSQLVVLAILRDEDDDPIPIGGDGEVSLRVRIHEDAPDDVLMAGFHDERGTFGGEDSGSTTIIVDVERDGEVVWSSPPLGVDVR